MVLLARNWKGEYIDMILTEIQFRQKLHKIIVKGDVVNIDMCLATNSEISGSIRIWRVVSPSDLSTRMHSTIT
jgi:hypothetical protein